MSHKWIKITNHEVWIDTNFYYYRCKVCELIKACPKDVGDWFPYYKMPSWNIFSTENNYTCEEVKMIEALE